MLLYHERCLLFLQEYYYLCFGGNYFAFRSHHYFVVIQYKDAIFYKL